MSERFEAKYKGIPVMATVDFDSDGVATVSKVVTRDNGWEFAGIDLEQFAQDNDYLIAQVKREIDEEIAEYSSHEKWVSNKEGWGR